MIKFIKKFIFLLSLIVVCFLPGCVNGEKEKHIHDWQMAWTIKEDYHWHICNGCDERTSYEKHNYVDGKCICGEVNGKSNIIFVLNEDGVSYSVDKINCCNNTVITIPAVYRGKPVSRINESALYDGISLSKVTIPESVVIVEKNAFSEGKNLTIYCEAKDKPVGWNDEWNNIDEDNFIPVVWGCNVNSTATDGNIYAIIDGIRYSIKDGFATVARQSKAITGNIVIPASVSYANKNYPVRSIDDWAFQSCYHLIVSITIPASIDKIASNVFSYNSSFTIYCEAKFKPDRWEDNWCFDNIPVVWDCRNNVVANDGCIYVFVDGIRYALKNGRATVAEQPKTISGEIIIPEQVSFNNKNYTVTCIGERAFSIRNDITDIVLPDTLTNIDSFAFYGCALLENINLPYGIISIDDWAFQNCARLSNIDIPGSVTSIGNDVFCLCTSLTSITIPGSVQNMGRWLCDGCDAVIVYCEANIKPSGWSDSWISSWTPVVWNYKNNSIATDGSIYISIDGIRYSLKDDFATVVRQANTLKGNIAIQSFISFENKNYPVTSIAKMAFRNCDDIVSCTIPESITSIESNSFMGCSSVIFYCELKVQPVGWGEEWCNSNPVVWDSKNNKTAKDGYMYATIDGIRYAFKGGFAIVAKQPKNLIGNINIPSELVYNNKNYPVIGIQSLAFSNCNDIVSVAVSDGIKYIDDGAFNYCHSLVSITMPESVIKVGYSSFIWPNYLKIYYKGTEDNWNNIAFGNSDIINHYYYHEDRPTEEGNYWHYLNGIPTVWY